MPRIGNKNTEIQLIDRAKSSASDDYVVGTAEKVDYSFIKDKGNPLPRAATVILYGVQLQGVEKLPDSFDVVGNEFNGCAFRYTKLENLHVQEEVDGQLVAIATALVAQS